MCKLPTYVIIKTNAKTPPKFAYKLFNYILKVKITPKSESKLYNYNKKLKCTNINSKLLFKKIGQESSQKLKCTTLNSKLKCNKKL